MLEASAPDQLSDELYTSILKRNGMLHLAGVSQKKVAIDYEVCWRLNQWDTVVEIDSKVNVVNDMEQEFQKHHFNALKCLHKQEENNSLAAVANSRYCITHILKEISTECLTTVYKYLTWLQFLQQTDDFCQIQFTSTTSINDFLNAWKAEVESEYGSFHCKEQILSHKIALLNTAGLRVRRKIQNNFKDNPIEIFLLKCVEECKYRGELNLAKHNISLLRNLKCTNAQTRAIVLLEDADICLKTGKPQIAKATLQYILKNKEFTYCMQRVRAFRIFGELLMESNAEDFDNVLKKFFNGSINLLNEFEKSKEQIMQKYPDLFDVATFDTFKKENTKCAYETIAKYADREYTELNTYIKSDEFRMRCRIIEENRQTANTIGTKNADRDKAITAIVMQRFANLDEIEFNSIKTRCTDNLCIAVANYMKFCVIDETILSPAIYRIIALWFGNKQNETLHKQIKEDINAVPSYKFVCALNQISAHLSSSNKEFVNVLKDLLIRCVQHHPHHTLYQLIPLVFASTDSTIIRTNNRATIANEIIAQATTKANSKCIKQMKQMFPVLIEFANASLSANKNAKHTLSDKLRQLKNLDAIQCPTIELPVSVSKEYNITSVLGWNNEVVLVNGINAPKKLQCLCSDGIQRLQLLKGKDDLRQDAVMQQVFSMINELLRSAPETIERRLKLRTYKIAPLSMRSGILEWCENTIPIGIYLAGDGTDGAHKKYRPEDYTIKKCRQLSMEQLSSRLEKRYQIYDHICEHIKPVFHYFFFEKFLEPGVWFERRLAYINSVATNSIVGYILGLGDRHTQNILIDNGTGEVIHIDFGIAFEQGKISRTPETVPFRLTRDIVAPMGVCETNGFFTKSCEATMHILRRNQKVITTILEVLLYDPLYMWKVVPQTCTSAENENEEKNLMAQRAVLCVQNKLESKIDVEVQVQRLINDAISRRNLCQLYPGWDPYL